MSAEADLGGVRLTMYSILIVEDEQAIANLISTYLSNQGYRCTCAYDGQQGADLVEGERFDLILLDIMLPEIDGYELLEYIKPTQTPVIFLTARGEVNDRIRGLRMGADDYLVKPFQMGELLARIEAVLRRYGKSVKQITFRDVLINTEARQVTKEGRPVELTVKEYDLLLELVRNKNVALYRDRLYEMVWNEPFLGDTRTLDTHIQRLRRKLGWEDCIKTVFRIGYRLEDNL